MMNVIFLPGQLIWEILSRRWFAGWIFCKLFKFCQTFSLASSNYMLITLAIDRHRAVTKPLTVSGSPCRWCEYYGSKKWHLAARKVDNDSLAHRTSSLIALLFHFHPDPKVWLGRVYKWLHRVAKLSKEGLLQPCVPGHLWTSADCACGTLRTHPVSPSRQWAKESTSWRKWSSGTAIFSKLSREFALYKLQYWKIFPCYFKEELLWNYSA